MASTILVKDTIWKIQVLLQDTAPQFRRWPEVEIVGWLNHAQVAIAKYLPLSASRVDAVRLVPGTKQSIASIPAAYCKPGDGSTPSVPINGTQLLNPRRNMGANGTTPGRAIRVFDRYEMDSQDPDWHTRVGDKVAGVVYDPETPRVFYVTPGVPTSPQVWIELAYTAKPIPIPAGGEPSSEIYKIDSASTATITIDDEFEEELVDYVVARAHLKEVTYAEPAKAAFYAQRFLNALNGKVAAITGNNPNLTQLPGLNGAGSAK